MNNIKTNLIQFSIGDWSDDGHGKQEVFVVESSAPVKVLRETYFAAIERLGVGFPCSQYGDNVFPAETYNIFVNNGVMMPALDEDDDGYNPTPEQFLEVLLAVIRWQNHKIKLNKFNIETFHFYGTDKKKRHIGHIGYGLFH